jgi:signal peptidase
MNYTRTLKIARRRLAKNFMNIMLPFALWNMLQVVTNTEYPLLVAASGGMMYGPSRGDLLFVGNQVDHFSVGDIVAFQLPDRDIPLFHRIIIVIDEQYQHGGIKNGKMTSPPPPPPPPAKYLTKGDDNGVDDRGLYPTGYLWLPREYIIGKVWGYLPLVGNVSIWMHDYPFFAGAVILYRLLDLVRTGTFAASVQWCFVAASALVSMAYS